MVVKREDCDLRMAFQPCFLRSLRDPIEEGALPEDGVLLVLGAVHALDGLDGLTASTASVRGSFSVVCMISGEGKENLVCIVHLVRL